MNIKTIKSQLTHAPKDYNVYFDFCRCIPTEIDSWRGIYAEPAIGWNVAGYSGNGKQITVKELLNILDDAISGRTFTGWVHSNYCTIGE